MKRLYYSVGLMLGVLFVGGCTSDLHYANSFINKFSAGRSSATEQIYVVLPREVIHTNSSLDEVRDFALLSERLQDSVIASKTNILNRLDDSIFLDQFNSAFLFTLSRTCIPVVLVDREELLPTPDEQHFTVAVAQVEAEEFVQRSRSDFTTRKGTYYAYDYDLRHFATHVWLHIDAHDTSAPVYFRTAEVEEHFSGTVKSIRDGKATLQTDFERIDVNDAYRLARRLGVECATLYVEKILAEYVCRAKGTNETYFYYDAGCNCIEATTSYGEGVGDSFEVLR